MEERSPAKRTRERPSRLRQRFGEREIGEMIAVLEARVVEAEEGIDAAIAETFRQRHGEGSYLLPEHAETVKRMRADLERVLGLTELRFELEAARTI